MGHRINGASIILCSFLLWLNAGTLQAQQPNILFIFSDDHTNQAISAYGDFLKDVAVTPSIDRLAREGMRFDRCYVTNSICGPSRAVIQTGKYSHVNGFRANDDSFDGSRQTFPKILRQNGYQTAVIGKWHLKSDPEGFDYWDVMWNQGEYYNPTMIRGNASGRLNTRTVTGYNSDIVGELAMNWLENDRDTNKPFMLMMQYKATHRGWAPGPGYYDMYDTVEIPEPATLFDDYSYRGSAAYYQDMSIRHSMAERDVKLVAPEGLGVLNGTQSVAWNAFTSKVHADFSSGGYNWDNKADDNLVRWKYKRYMQDYLACGAHMDQNIGRVLQYLDDHGLADNTVVIYSSDQGFYVGEHGWFDKRFMYEESLRTPFIVRWPGVVTPGSANETDIVSNLDFPETFLDIAGIDVPPDMQGRSLVPILEGRTPQDWRRSFYYQYFEGPYSWHAVHRHYGVTTGRYKLIYYHDVDEWEFYDLAKDSNEMINQYYISENDSIIQVLKAELSRLREELGVPADPPRDNALPTVTIQQWTEPLDDPTSVALGPSFAAGPCPVLYDGHFLVIGSDSFHQIRLFNLSGRCLGSLVGKGRKRYVISELRPASTAGEVYVLKVTVPGVSVTLKAIDLLDRQ